MEALFADGDYQIVGNAKVYSSICQVFAKGLERIWKGAESNQRAGRVIISPLVVR